MMNNMNPNKLSNWAVWSGCIGVVLYAVALVLAWQSDSSLLFDRFDKKDLYFAGSGFLYIAIWFKLGAIFHKGSGQNM